MMSDGAAPALAGAQAKWSGGGRQPEQLPDLQAGAGRDEPASRGGAGRAARATQAGGLAGRVMVGVRLGGLSRAAPRPLRYYRNHRLMRGTRDRAPSAY